MRLVASMGDVLVLLRVVSKVVHLGKYWDVSKVDCLVAVKVAEMGKQ